MMTTVFDLTSCPSAFVPESELSHNVEAHHGLVPKLGHHEWKNLKNNPFGNVCIVQRKRFYWFFLDEKRVPERDNGIWWKAGWVLAHKQNYNK